MNSYIGYKINHSLPLGYAITWVQSGLVTGLFTWANIKIAGMKPIKFLEINKKARDELERRKAQMTIEEEAHVDYQDFFEMLEESTEDLMPSKLSDEEIKLDIPENKQLTELEKNVALLKAELKKKEEE